MGGSEKTSFYLALASLLATDDKFISILEVGRSHEARVAVTDCLVSCLKSLKAPATMTNSREVFSDFVSFCRNPNFRHQIPKALGDALQVCRDKVNEAARLRRILCFKAGLNWKSPLQTARRARRLSEIPRWVAIDLEESYPPQGHWVAENDAIYDLWKGYLKTRKMHDKRTALHPIHKLDPEALVHDLLPDQEAIFEDGFGDESAPLWFPRCFCSPLLPEELIGVVIRNFCWDPKIIEFINRVIQLSVEVKRNVRVSTKLWPTA